MFLTESYANFLALNLIFLVSLTICLALQILPRFRRRSNPFAWVVWGYLVLGALYYAQYPIAGFQESNFKSTHNRQIYVDREFVVRSVRLRDPGFSRIEQAAYSCAGSHSFEQCYAPLLERVGDRTLDFIEMGESPTIRYESGDNDGACLGKNSELPSQIDDRHIASDLAMCITAREVETSTAGFLLAVEGDRLAWPSEMPYSRVSLTHIETGEIVDQFVSWDGERPYTGNQGSLSSEKGGPLTQLLVLSD